MTREEEIKQLQLLKEEIAKKDALNKESTIRGKVITNNKVKVLKLLPKDFKRAGYTDAVILALIASCFGILSLLTILLSVR